MFFSNITIALSLFVLAVVLFLAAHFQIISDNILQRLTNIGGIIAAVAGILVFAVPNLSNSATPLPESVTVIAKQTTSDLTSTLTQVPFTDTMILKSGSNVVPPTDVPTNTLDSTNTPTNTFTPTNTRLPTAMPTFTPTPTYTPVPTVKPTATTESRPTSEVFPGAQIKYQTNFDNLTEYISNWREYGSIYIDDGYLIVDGVSSGAVRRTSLGEGDALLVRFRSDSKADANIVFFDAPDSGTKYIGVKHRLDISLGDSNGWIGGQLDGNLEFKADRWYYALVEIRSGGHFYLKVWDEEYN